MRRLILLAMLAGAPACWGGDPPPIDYSHGVKWFPKFWRAYRSPQIPPPDLANGSRLSGMIQNGALQLSLRELNDLIEENSLDILAARYNVDIAETDVLRAKSGQAARGAPGVPLPGEIFSSALGAGIGAASGTNGGGVGPAAISAAARQVVVGPRGTFDPDVQVTASFDHATSPLNTLQVAGVNAVSTPSADVLTRFEKAFSTGFSFAVSFNSQRQGSTQQFLRFDPAYTSRLSVSAYQPLLNGFGYSVNRRFIDLANNDVGISRQLFRQQISAALVNAQNAYWDLVAAREMVAAAQRAVETAQELFEDTQRQQQLGVSAPLDVTQSRSALAGSRRDLIVAQTNEKTQELGLKALICKSLNQLADIDVTTTDSLPEPSDNDIPSVQDALKTASSHRSELLQADLTIHSQEIAEKYTRNLLKPTFGVFAVYASSALEAATVPMLGQVWVNVPYPDYAIGFSVNIPLRNRSAQADNVRARLELSQQRTARARTSQQIELDARSAVIALVQAKAQVEAGERAVESSKAAFEAEQVKLKAGVSTPYRVVQMQRDYVAAQAQQIQAQANYAKARIQLDRARGMVLERNNVSLDRLLGSSWTPRGIRPARRAANEAPETTAGAGAP